MRKDDEGGRRGSGGDLPGFGGVEGRMPDEPRFRAEPKPRLIPVNRTQMRIVPVDVERLIPDDHEARAIWGFVGRLDLAPYYEEIASVEGGGGRPAYDPQVLMSLWIYGYSKGIGSARELARRTEHDPPFQWIAALEIVNYHTLSDFRIAHKESLDRIFVEVLGILSAEGLITLERTTQDGTKVKACAGRRQLPEREENHGPSGSGQTAGTPPSGLGGGGRLSENGRRAYGRQKNESSGSITPSVSSRRCRRKPARRPA